MTTRQIPSSAFTAGMIVHMGGARFRLRDDVKRHEPRKGDDLPTYTATGDWLDGSVEPGYFGPTRPWKFQGNDHARWTIETGQ